MNVAAGGIYTFYFSTCWTGTLTKLSILFFLSLSTIYYICLLFLALSVFIHTTSTWVFLNNNNYTKFACCVVFASVLVLHVNVRIPKNIQMFILSSENMSEWDGKKWHMHTYIHSRWKCKTRARKKYSHSHINAHMHTCTHTHSHIHMYSQ